MKFTIFAILLILGASNLAQNYIPLTDHRSEWHVTTCLNGCITDIYHTDGDTIYNGEFHKVLNGYHYISRTFWLREDIPNQQIFLSYFEPFKGRSEALLYDFSLNIGDSIELNNPITPFPNPNGYFKLDSIVPKTLLDGLDHRFFYLSPTASNSSTELPIWIEGIGSLSLINSPGGGPDINDEGALSCYFSEDGAIYTNLDSISDCSITVLNTHQNTLESNLSLFPNPANDILHLDLLNATESNYTIYSLSGEVLANGVFQNIIPVSKLKKGLYILEVTSDFNKLTSRFIKN